MDKLLGFIKQENFPPLPNKLHNMLSEQNVFARVDNVARIYENSRIVST
jgi:hypothetical protein